MTNIDCLEQLAELSQQVCQNIQKTPFLGLLYGPLGAGKTTFVHYFVQNLGLDDTLVHSPSYTIMNVYDQKVLHLDLYRLEDRQAFYDYGLTDVIPQYPYTLIEWPELIENWSFFDTIGSIWECRWQVNTLGQRRIVQRWF